MVVIPLIALRPDPDNPRKSHSASEFDQLVASIRTDGVLLPLRVKSANAAGMYIIVSGHRRYKAMLALGQTEADCIIVDGPLDEASILAEQIVENVIREDLNPIEEADAYRRYIDLKKITAAQAAAELHVAPSRLSRLLPLCDLPEVIRERVASGTIPQETAYYLTRLPEGDERHRMMALASEGKLSRDEAARAAKISRSAPAESPTVSRVTCKLSAERTLTLAAPTIQMDLLLETLEEVLKQARKARQQGLDVTTLAKIFRDRVAAGGAA